MYIIQKHFSQSVAVSSSLWQSLAVLYICVATCISDAPIDDVLQLIKRPQTGMLGRWAPFG